MKVTWQVFVYPRQALNFLLSQGRLCTWDPPVSISWMLELQKGITMPCLYSSRVEQALCMLTKNFKKWNYTLHSILKLFIYKVYIVSILAMMRISIYLSLHYFLTWKEMTVCQENIGTTFFPHEKHSLCSKHKQCINMKSWWA